MTFLRFCNEYINRKQSASNWPGYQSDLAAMFALNWILDNDAPRGWISELTFERYVTEFCPEDRMVARRVWRDYQDERKGDQWSETAPNLT